MNAPTLPMYAALVKRIRERARAAGVPVDTYDPDFFLGVIMEWLDQNDAVLTGTGVRRLKNANRSLQVRSTR